MFFADALTLDAPKRLKDGYVAVRARAARTGVYQYTGREVDPDNSHGLRDQAVVNVLRDEQTVFDKAAVHSFIGKPITIDHPRESVTSANWKDHARGTVMGALRDGDHLAFDLLLMDKAAIADVEAGKRQLSNGYAAEVQFGDFAAPDGTKCQARQSRISDGNHVALLFRGRGGDTCSIADAATCESIPLPNLTDQETTTVKTMLIDGLTVDISNADIAQATIATILAARDAASTKVAGLETQVATLTAEGQTKDAKIVTLEQRVKDAKPTPAHLRDAGKALLITADKAKALGVAVTDEMDESQIMRAAVDNHFKGTPNAEVAKNWSDAEVAASFAVLTKDAKPGETQTFNRDAFRGGLTINDNGASVRDLARAMQF